MVRFIKKTGKLFPNKNDSAEARYYKTIIFIIVCLLLFMVLSSVITFFMTLRGEEKVLIPDVQGMKLEQGLIDLQEKELYPKVQLRFTSNPAQKGTIINQEPSPGTLVKAGKRISIVVSKGAVIDKVENFVGQELTEVKIHLQTIFTSNTPLLTIKQPVTYVYNDSPPGTILEQKPEPGTKLSEPKDLELVVSRGPAGEVITISDYTGKRYREALDSLARQNQPFVFTAKEAEGDEEPGVIISQNPETGKEVPAGTTIQFVMTKPEKVEEGKLFGMFKYSLPSYPVYVDLELKSITQDGETDVLYSSKHPGGPIAIPYIVKKETRLVLYIQGREEIREYAGSGN